MEKSPETSTPQYNQLAPYRTADIRILTMAQSIVSFSDSLDAISG